MKFLTAIIALCLLTNIARAADAPQAPALTAQEAGTLSQLMQSAAVTYTGNNLGVVVGLIQKLNAISTYVPPAKTEPKH